jgi:hypothetical protein
MQMGFAEFFAAPQSDFHSEACRQERIEKIAKSIAADMRKTCLADSRDAHDVAEEFATNIATEVARTLIRCRLAGADISAMHLIDVEISKAIGTIAELRAIKHVEEHGAE